MKFYCPRSNLCVGGTCVCVLFYCKDASCGLLYCKDASCGLPYREGVFLYARSVESAYFISRRLPSGITTFSLGRVTESIPSLYSALMPSSSIPLRLKVRSKVPKLRSRRM